MGKKWGVYVLTRAKGFFEILDCLDFGGSMLDF